MIKIGEFRPVNLLGGDMYRSTKAAVLAAGFRYPAGAVLAQRQDGKCVHVDSKTTDKTVYGILSDEVDATSADSPGIVYLTGEFCHNQLTFGGTDTYVTHNATARSAGLFFVDSESIPE